MSYELSLQCLQKWFEENKTIDQNITKLLSEIENPTYEIGRRVISFEYILGFLYEK